MTGSGSRKKGHKWEREVARMIREAMPGCEARRGFQLRGGHEAADVECPHFHIECKVGRKQNPRAALEQARRDNGGAPGKRPVAVIKDDQEKPGVPANTFVVMGLQDWLSLVNQWYTRTGGGEQ